MHSFVFAQTRSSVSISVARTLRPPPLATRSRPVDSLLLLLQFIDPSYALWSVVARRPVVSCGADFAGIISRRIRLYWQHWFKTILPLIPTCKFSYRPIDKCVNLPNIFLGFPNWGIAVQLVDIWRCFGTKARRLSVVWSPITGSWFKHFPFVIVFVIAYYFTETCNVLWKCVYYHKIVDTYIRSIPLHTKAVFHRNAFWNWLNFF